jgi:hypothetical protein
MTKKETSIPERKSDRIAMMIAKANQVATIDWLHAILEEQAEPIRREMAEAAGRQVMATLPEFVRSIPAVDPKAIEAAKPSKKNVKLYWDRMTPEERSAEMKRRVSRRGQRKGLTHSEALKLHPRDKRSPRHGDWVEMMRNVQKQRFANMSVRQRKQWQGAMLAGRQQQAQNQRVNGATQ